MSAVRRALVAHARGEVVCPPPGQLLFTEAHGDCHIKFAHSPREPLFCVKVATGFYHNPARQLPVNNGIVLLFDSRTGAPVAVLQDQGWLTSWRTAAAGALAALAGAPPSTTVMGVIGAGHQAQMQALWTSRALGFVPIMLYGRNEERTQRAIEQLRSRGRTVVRAKSISEVARACRLIICCTNAAQPLFRADVVKSGTHIVSIGADGPGKSELDGALFRRAATVFTDDHAHCLAHGDFGRAVRQGFVGHTADVHLGTILGDCPSSSPRAAKGDITIATLTGLGAQDLAIAARAWAGLSARAHNGDARDLHDLDQDVRGGVRSCFGSSLSRARRRGSS